MITGRLKWYYSRLSTMNVPEIIFRAKQIQQRSFEKIFTPKPEYHHVTVNKVNFDFSFTEALIPGRFMIFGHPLEIGHHMDFHMDIFSRKRFPLSFAKTIDIRTDRFGSAKAVWEVNRLQFLIPLLTDYKITKDRSKLDLFVSIMTTWNEQNPYLKGIHSPP